MNTRSAAGILLALGATVLLGLFLRWQLAGAVALFADNFANLRRVHTHLGFYGALLPLAWLAAYDDDNALPRATGALYALFVLVAHVGFALAGYGVLAIAGSTGVLGTWLYGAWRRRRLVVDGDGWLSGAPLAIPVAAACIPAIAVTLRRDPSLSAGIVQSFLSVLVLGVLVPAAMHVAGARAPKKPWWIVAALMGAVGLGFTELSYLLLPVAALVLIAALRSRMDLLLRLLWLAFGVGAAAIALRLLPLDSGAGVAALHYAVLGPILLGLAWPYVERVHPLVPVAWVAAVVAMSTAIFLRAPTAAALTGSVVVLLLMVGVALILAPSFRASVRRTTASPEGSPP
ncbi:MAG: hypothetical protein IT383_23715 [Deltaproteobacteria bacterium]|nr:hypothetical protein [Deltaproteobacteria bacterium]